MYRNRAPSNSVSESAVSPWMASILMRRGGNALQRFALTYHQLAAMPRRWRRQLRRKAAVGLGSAALVLALAGPIVAAPARQTAAPEAIITVVDGEVANVNNNKCGLIEAIINARTSNAGAMRPDCAPGNLNGPDTVSLPANGTFVLTEAHNEQFGPTGLPVITSVVTIEGNGSSIHRSADADPFRILAVDANGSLTLRDMTISGGYADYPGGGGIANYGTLAILNSAVVNNISDDSGGGIHSQGQLTITNSMVANNYSGRNSDYGPGGGINTYGQAIITGSIIIGNVSSGPYGSEGGGIAIRGQATIIDCTIAENDNLGTDSGGRGGGVWVGWGAEVTINGSTIRDNVVHEFYEYEGGGYYSIWPGYGGGLFNDGKTLIVNTTISGNDAEGAGGGLANTRFGELTVVQSTITKNTGEGIFSGESYWMDNCSTTTLRGTIVSGNTGDQISFTPTPPGSDECYDENYLPTSAVFNRDSFNVFGQNGDAGLNGISKGATDIVPTVGLNAILSALADNGGLTQTHALPANSPALDVAPNASCAAAPVNGVDQRGQPRNQNAKGGATNSECDAGAYERDGSVAQMGFFLSTTTAGTVGGVAFAPGDIIKFTPGGGWSMHFDASDVGITKNVVAFEIEDNGNILLSLVAPQTVPGAGNVAAQDVIRFTPGSTGNTTAGTFAMALDGSANLLTTSGEKIDALGLTTNGRIALSTVGAAAVKRPDNSVLKAQDEDALGFNLGNSQWSEFFNGTAIPGLAVEDVNALWIDPVTGDLYISIVGAFNLGGVAGNGRDIVKLSPSGAPGGYTPSLFWDGSANGFPTNIDGLEMIP